MFSCSFFCLNFHFPSHSIVQKFSSHNSFDSQYELQVINVYDVKLYETQIFKETRRKIQHKPQIIRVIPTF